ncbi:hypothetical protein J5TS2_43270 [Brevibacillus halotolerans]|nr:hypothetical protein J5TS2_43270 [Brevibacillus halotolerans]
MSKYYVFSYDGTPEGLEIDDFMRFFPNSLDWHDACLVYKAESKCTGEAA